MPAHHQSPEQPAVGLAAPRAEVGMVAGDSLRGVETSSFTMAGTGISIHSSGGRGLLRVLFRPLVGALGVHLLVTRCDVRYCASLNHTRGRSSIAGIVINDRRPWSSQPLSLAPTPG